MPHNIQDLVADQPEVVLALSLSAPHPRRPGPRTEKRFAVEVTGDEWVIRTPAAKPPKAGRATLLGTKETIAVGVLLLDYWRRESSRRIVEARRKAQQDPSSTAPPPDDGVTEADIRPAEQSLTDAMADCLSELARATLDPNRPLLPQPNATQLSTAGLLSPLLGKLKITAEEVKASDDRCSQAFRRLEREGWAIDPGFLPFELPPELMLLFGLVPMQWSVRTPTGEQAYREVRVSAPLWSLSINRIREGRKKPFTNWELNIRGVGFVRRLLTSLAQSFLGIEEEERRAQGRPVLPPPKELSTEPQDEEE